MNIVAVDDSEVLREYISMLLECDGHTVYPAESAATAVETIATTTIDLVLSDVHMEGMDGFTLARTLRANPAHADIPIVFVTGDETEEFKTKSRLSGANGWLKKPFNAEQLLKLVRTFDL